MRVALLHYTLPPVIGGVERLVGDQARALAAMPLVQARVWNTTWNSFTLGAVRFRSTLSPWRLVGVMLSNVALTMVTLGLYAPFAAVRLHRTRVESLEVVSTESPTFLAAHDGTTAGTTGDSVVDDLGLDVGL